VIDQDPLESAQCPLDDLAIGRSLQAACSHMDGFMTKRYEELDGLA